MQWFLNNRLTEEALIEQLKLKNTAVFSNLIDTYQQKVFGTCLSFVPNKEDAEDLVQEVFLEVFNSISKFSSILKVLQLMDYICQFKN